MSLSILINKVPALLGSNSGAAATKAMTELGVAACIGAGCVHGELISQTQITALSKTTFGILLPMFLGSSILKTVATYGLRKSSLAGPLLGILQPFLLYQLTTQILLPILGIDCNSDDGRCTAVCSAWGNTSVLPLIFADSLFRNHENKELLEQFYAAVSLFLVGWSPFFWSYGKSVLFNEESNIKGKESPNILIKCKQLFSPPVTGISIGLVLAMIAPLRRLFISEQSAPLATVHSTFQTFGKAAAPLSLLVLTSSLALGLSGNTKQNTNNKKRYDKGTQASSSLLRQWMCVSISRFVVSPILMLFLLSSFQHFQFIDSYENDPILWFAMIMQGCMPPAQNLVLMLQVANKQEKASDMAKFLFGIYATAMVPVVLILGYALETFNLV